MNSFLAALNMRPFLAGSGPDSQVLGNVVAMEVLASSGGLRTFGEVSTRASRTINGSMVHARCRCRAAPPAPSLGLSE
jgi:hypothetical protein